jgi:formamidopyrimidine-DNA glycosylase
LRYGPVMPELPEVETVRRGLEPTLVGARFARVEQRRPDLRFLFPEDFVARLTGARVLSLDRRGKYIQAPLDTGETLIVHLGMTGRFKIEAGASGIVPGAFAHAAPDAEAHAHVVFETDRGARITFFDARRFGFMDIARTDALGAYPAFAAMGPEPLGSEFDADYLQRRLTGRRQSIKAMLLDQSTVAGLGNIYVNEALHRAHIDPRAEAGELSRSRLKRLIAAIRAVLAEAIEAGGSTLRDYAGADGAPGYFQHVFRVYGRAGEPCPARGCKGVVQRIVQNGRSTFLCDGCQS